MPSKAPASSTEEGKSSFDKTDDAAEEAPEDMLGSGSW
jgi:hypothetical protein